ncbi:MAG: universal stress protein [Gammaproteobacteria bacterium]
MTHPGKTQPILVPVDFSPYSEAALSCAIDMAETLGAPLTVLHVVHDLAEAPGYYAVKGRKKELQRLEDLAAEMLHDYIEQMQKKQPERQALKKAATMLVAGLPVSRILETAEKIDARMIIMGSQGRTGLAHVMLGSKAEQVVRLSPIPVLIVKADKKTASAKNND